MTVMQLLLGFEICCIAAVESTQQQTCLTRCGNRGRAITIVAVCERDQRVVSKDTPWTNDVDQSRQVTQQTQHWTAVALQGI